MSEVKMINRDIVPADELQWLPRYGRGFEVPAGCLDCVVLTTKRSAEARGLTVISQPGLAGTNTERYFPQSKESEMHEELEERVQRAVDGACKFILQQECWRVEIEE